MRRILTVAAVAVAMSIPVSVATVSLAGTAGAVSTVQCKGLAGTITGTVTISKCTPSGGKGYKSASGLATNLATGGNITWKTSGATTTIGDASATQVVPSTCPKADTGGEYSFTGQVTAASTSGTGIPAVGDTVSATACIGKTGKISLLKHTVMER
jgi:hypothetical protein